MKRGELVFTGVENVKGEVRNYSLTPIQANIVNSRGKKRMGYELELKLKLKGMLGSRWEGLECAFDFEELCDDGDAP